MLKEGGVIRIFLPVIMRPGIRHGEIHELQALPVLGLFNLALRALNNPGDGFDMRVQGKSGNGCGERQQGDQ